MSFHHSSTVTLGLIVGDRTYDVAEGGPEHLTLRETSCRMASLWSSRHSSDFGLFAGLTVSINFGLPMASQIAFKMNCDRFSLFFLQCASTAVLIAAGIRRLMGGVSVMRI